MGKASTGRRLITTSGFNRCYTTLISLAGGKGTRASAVEAKRSFIGWIVVVASGLNPTLMMV